MTCIRGSKFGGGSIFTGGFLWPPILSREGCKSGLNVPGLSEFEDEVEDCNSDDDTGLKRFGVLGKKHLRFAIL